MDSLLSEIQVNPKILLNVKRNLKSAKMSKKPRKPLTIESTLELLENPGFKHKIITSLRKLYREKEARYKRMIETLQKNINEDQANYDLLKPTVQAQDLDDMFPMLITNKIYLSQIKNLVSISQSFKLDTDEQQNQAIANIREAISDKTHGLASLTGNARAFIREDLLRKVIALSRGHESFLDSFNNLIFMGSAGVGKTKLAKTVGFFYKKLGILLNGDLIIASPKDLVGTYLGQTAPKTAGVLMKGIESVVFIDEAYQIMPCTDGKIGEVRSYGPESITEIVNFLDKFVGMSIMIVAGYEREIKGCFLEANSGLDRRFPHRWVLPNYSPYELTQIFLREIVNKLQTNIFDKEISVYTYGVINQIVETYPDVFVNQAGDMVNMATCFITSYFSLVKYNWNADFESKTAIMKDAINTFLLNKKLYVD